MTKKLNLKVTLNRWTSSLTVTKRGGKESKNEDVEECGRAFILYEISCERMSEQTKQKYFHRIAFVRMTTILTKNVDILRRR